MPTLAAIVLADGQASPVNRTFTPESNNGNTIVFNDGADPVSAQTTMQITLSKAKKKNDFTVVSAVIRSPYLDATTGAVLFYDQARIEFRQGYGSLLAKRKDQFAFAKNLLANADFKTMVQDRLGLL
jgi:hypothetical protein